LIAFLAAAVMEYVTPGFKDVIFNEVAASDPDVCVV
jgi:hypothetical protein